MGMFDTVHTERGCEQVKCLGKTLSDVRVGDHATLRRSPNEDELEQFGRPDDIELDSASTQEFEQWASHPFNVAVYDGVPRTETSWQIDVEAGYLVFIDNTFDGWYDTPVAGIVTVDRRGRDVDVDAWRPGAPAELCDMCYHDANHTP